MKYLLYLLAGTIPLLASISGRVVDARGGEPLARVRIRMLGASNLETATNPEGRFRLEAVASGSYTLQVETVGYRLIKQTVTVIESEDQNIDIVLSPETFQRTETVEVRAGAFEVEEASPASAPLTLTGAEVKNLSTVLMDDPIRAVHALPGVAANNDFQSQFTLRGADFRRIGLYIDDVLVHMPFHSIANEGDASLSMLNGEMVSDMLLLPIAFPARYSDRTAGILELRTREGSRLKRSIRVVSGVAATSVLAEAPFAGGKGTWIASARKSYLQYLLKRLNTENGLLIGYMDVQARLGYSLTDRQQVSLYVLDGVTDLDRTTRRQQSGVNALIEAKNRSTLTKASWQYTPVSKFVLTATGAWLRERFHSINRESRPIDYGAYGEWIGNGRASWQMSTALSFEGGWSTRRMRDEGFAFRYLNNPPRVLQQDRHRGTGPRNGA
ncbi:MAG TPA: carboxypeptidase regulatory-like domain-containing protein [Bryobacteraceae bacterium]|nr:carboxypeptidase regulatory-like domain-containing protein [Bryobacteraceae bacterium]